MSARAKLSFSHMGVFATDIHRMVDFYTRVLGLVVSDRDARKDGIEIAFMTLDPREHHHVHDDHHKHAHGASDPSGDSGPISISMSGYGTRTPART